MVREALSAQWSAFNTAAIRGGSDIRHPTPHMGTRCGSAVILCATILLLAGPSLAGDTGAVGDLYVTGRSSDNVVQFDGETGDFVAVFVTEVTPPDPPGHSFSKLAQGLMFGPNGNLFVIARDAHRVREFDGQTGALIGDFTPFDDPATYTDNSGPSGGWLANPYDLVFSPDGNLLVMGTSNRAVLAYAANTGEWLGTFAIGGSSPGGLGKSQFLALGPDGHVFAVDTDKNEVLEYHPTTGRLVRVFVEGEGIIDWPNGLAFGPNGNLFVVSFWDNSVVEFDGQTGAFVGTFASGGELHWPRDLTFGPNGNLFVVSDSDGGVGVEGVIEYDGQSGAVIGTFATSDELVNPWGLTFKAAPPDPMPGPTVTSLSVGQHNACQSLMGVTVTGTNLDPAKTIVKLAKADEPDYFGAVVSGSPDGTSLTVDFDLDGGARMAGGQWDVEVVNPDGQTDVLPSALEITPCYAAGEENLFVLGYRHRIVTRHGLFEYDGASGDLIGFMVEDESGTAGDDLGYSTGFVFGHDGNVLITSLNPSDGSVLQYDGITGRKIGTFILAGTGSMLKPRKLTFGGPSGNLFVLHRNVGCTLSGVLEFDGLTGTFVRDFVPLGSCGLQCAHDFEFGPDGDLYLTDVDGGVFVFDGQTGACVGGAALLPPPTEPDTAFGALEFSSHSGDLVLPWWGGCPGLGRVTEHDPETGDLLATPIPPPAGDISQAAASDFGPSGHLFVAGASHVFEYDLLAEEVLGIFATQTNPSGMAPPYEIVFGPRAGDADGDWDLDLGDFAAFQRCFGGDGVAPSNYNCLTFDHDRDGDIDAADLAAFSAAMTGPS